MRLLKNCKNLVFAAIQCGKVQRLQAIFCKGKLCLLCGSERFGGGISQCLDFGSVLIKPKTGQSRPIPASPRHGSHQNYRSGDPDCKSDSREASSASTAQQHPGCPAFHSKNNLVTSQHEIDLEAYRPQTASGIRCEKFLVPSREFPALLKSSYVWIYLVAAI